MRSTSVRLSLAFAALVTAAFMIAGGLIWRSTSNAAEAQIRLQIELEISAIEHELETEGLDAAIAAIASRMERPGAFEYWVTDSLGRHLIGELRELDGPNGWRKIDIDGAEAGAEGVDDLLVLTKSLPAGVRVSVGEDLARSEEIQAAILRTMALIGGLTVMGCLIAGMVIARSALGKIQILNHTMNEASKGNLGARYRVRNAASPSDIDDIGASVNDMLQRIELLIDNTKRVTRDVAHDLRTPLSHLRQRLESAANDADPESRRSAIVSSQEKVEEIIRMFDATLRLAEIDAGSAKTRFKNVELAGLAERVVDAYRPDMEASGRFIHIERIDDGAVFGDAELITQALANLIENAMRHTPERSVVNVSVVSGSDEISLIVADNGPGIPAEARELLLEPFTRLDESRSSAGAGLGLSIVAAVARLHEATLLLGDAASGLIVSIIFDRKTKAAST